MKKPLLLPFSIAVAACILAALCLWQVVGLKQQLNTAETNLHSAIAYAQSEIGSIYSHVKNALQQEASLLVDSGWSYGDPDFSTYTVPVTFTVTPKTVMPDVTSAELICSDQRFPMTLQNGTFSGSKSLDLFSSLEISQVVFTENGRQSVESLDWALSPRYAVLPELRARTTGITTLSRSHQNDKHATLELGGLEIYADTISSEAPPDIQTFYILEKQNGEIRRRTEIDPDDISPYQAMGYYAAWNQAFTCAIPYGELYELFVELVDQHGLRHQLPLARYELTPDGRNVRDTPEDQTLLNRSADIYGPDGNLLFQAPTEP